MDLMPKMQEFNAQKRFQEDFCQDQKMVVLHYGLKMKKMTVVRPKIHIDYKDNLIV